MTKPRHDPPQLIRSTAIADAAAFHSHPWNANSELYGTHISRLAGLQRTGISLVRLAPGRESFVYHLHHREEEWIYILSGEGTAEIDGREYSVGPGDFMGFPTPSVGHHLRNTGTGDLTYLMGGENREYEIADFPRLNKRMIRRGETVEIYDLDAGHPMTPYKEQS